MRTSMRTGLQVALVVGGGIFFSAQASADDTTTGRDSLLGGTQVVTSIEVPVTVSGNSVSVVGDSRSSRHHHDKAAVRPSRDGATRAGSTSTSGADSLAGGTQVVAPVSVPVTVGGNAVSVIGDSRSSDGGTGAASGGSDSAGIGSTSTSGEDSLAGGTQVVAPVSVPVTVGGNALSVPGDSNTDPVQPTNPVEVMLASDGRQDYSRAALARAAALSPSGPIAVVTIAKIYGSSFGLPHPGLLPTKAELDERRGWVEAAVGTLKARGTTADGQVAATRRAAKKLAAVARARGAQVIVIDETTVSNPLRRLIEGDVGTELRRKLRKDGVEVEVVPHDKGGTT